MEDIYHHITRLQKAKQKFIETGCIKIGDELVKIREDNKKLALDWMAYKEQELRDIYGRSDDAKVRNSKTLYKQFTTYIANVLFWFNHKSLKDITEEDIIEVYHKLESQEFKGTKGNPLCERTLKDIYSRVFKNGFFVYIGKSDIAKKVIRRKIVVRKDVRFFDYETFQKIVNAAELVSHRLAYWLLFDTGIEVAALVQLRKSNFEFKKGDKEMPEGYMLHIPQDISKKGRQFRSNYIYFQQTNLLLKDYLEPLDNDEKLFKFDPPAIYRALQRLNEKYHFKVKPQGQSVVIKDFRSSCATYLLGQGWTTDEVKGRLGHSPSSDEIDRYVNYLGHNKVGRRVQDTKIDFNNYKRMFEESMEELNQMKAKQKEMNKDMAKVMLLMQAKETIEKRRLDVNNAERALQKILDAIDKK